MALHQLVKQKALEAGFDIAGIAPLDVWKDLDFARRWVEQGYGGEMHYLQNPKRHDPRQVLPSAQSVVCVGLVYNAPLPYSTEAAHQAPAEGQLPTASEQGQSDACSAKASPRGWISRYGWGQDYHDILRSKLEDLRRSIENLAPGVETRVYVDTGPVVERAFARYSGIGWMGKNTCLINQAKGSWFFLGVVLTNLPLAPDLPAPDRCGSCTRCLDACPTGALVKPYVMDASRCIAYFNIELKGSIPQEYRPAIGSNVFGCDICQDVCPWNRGNDGREAGIIDLQRAEIGAAKGFGRAGRATTDLSAFQPLEVTLAASRTQPDEGPAGKGDHTFSLFNPSLENLAQLSEEDFCRAFARSPLKRPKYRGWLRNLAVVMGNSGDRRFVPKLEELSRHDDPLVREHAQWALARLAEARSPADTPVDNIRYNEYIGAMAKRLQAEIKQKAPFPSLEEEVFLNLLRTGDALSQQAETLLRAAGLSATQYNVLRILRGAGRDGLTCGETGSRMVTHDSDITRLLDRLEKRKLIARERGVRDRRVVTARITRQGLQLLGRLDQPVAKLNRSLFRHMKRRDLEKLSALLEAARSPEG